VAAGRPLAVVLALRPDERDQLLLEPLVHHLEADPDREGKQALTHRAGQIVEGELHLARQAQPVELLAVGDPSGVVLLHLAVLLMDWSPSPPALPAGGDGGPPAKINPDRDKLPVRGVAISRG
jgi:hypothetical protein